jgi:glycosyltransferase involved in cell wall biosynthesis
MPNVSVLIATYNRAEYLKKILPIILAQEIENAFTFDIIVIDNNSTDNTREVAEQFGVKYLFEPKQGKSFALNMGIKEAKTDLLVFTDDDTVPDSKWLLNLYRCFQSSQCDAIGGRILSKYPLNTPQWIKDSADLLVGPIVNHDYGSEIKIYEQSLMFPFYGSNMAVKRSVLEKMGDFRTDLGVGTRALGEDTEFFKRLIANQCKVLYCGEALVWHPAEYNRMNLRYIAKWHMALGRYYVITKSPGIIQKNSVCYFGVPRYLLKDLIILTLSLIPTILNRRNFLKVWIKLFIKVGIASEIKKEGVWKFIAIWIKLLSLFQLSIGQNI